MTVALWRIAVEGPVHSANKIDANTIKSGRWNSAGTPVAYASESVALATLETLVHLQTDVLPYDRFLVRIDVPDSVWALRETLSPPGGWDAIPAGAASKQAGDKWIASRRSPLLLVPSVIVPEEFNILLNPLHDAFPSIAATTVRRGIYDPRFF